MPFQHNIRNTGNCGEILVAQMSTAPERARPLQMPRCDVGEGSTVCYCQLLLLAE
jgi:hypothetical protein